MINLLFYELIKGNDRILEYFNSAKDLWIDIVSSPDFLDEEKFIKTLHMKQSAFENKCGGKNLGEIIFALVGIGQYYDYNVGFDQVDNIKKAKKIFEGFKKSACSWEVKFAAEQLAEIYQLK